MLSLKDIHKDYEMGNEVVHALRGVSIDFRDSEFVAILGQSGCGKTTLLNIIGGLDSYTYGDLVIDGTSTRRFKDAQWDAYRNHSIGFVFQSYNLIPHQTVLSNVELALKLSRGVPALKHKKKAMEALDAVGLANQAKKKPSMMSGGQMQRVAIARALVNNPRIILADEPTGALDSQTSVQVMDILREVAEKRLVIMVTHNPELAERYATRIIRLRDGEVVDDSNPVMPEDASTTAGRMPKRTRLSLLTALGLSLQNLLTKKGRTLLTAFAGAIGIMGIALILSLSNGVSEYIETVERDTMGSYPIELQRETFSLDMSEEDMPSFDGDPKEILHNLEAIYSRNIVADTVKQQESMIVTNDLGAFKSYLDDHRDQLNGSVLTIEYGYGIVPHAYRLDKDDKVIQVSPASLLDDEYDMSYANMGSMSMMLGSSNGTSWQQLPTNKSLRKAGYELVSGQWPSSADEAVLILTKNNEVSDYVLYTLGLMDSDHLEEIVKAAKEGDTVKDPQVRVSYDDVLGLRFSVLSPCQLYKKNEDGLWYDASDESAFMKEAYDKGIEVRIAGIVRAGEDAKLTSGVAYDARLAKKLMDVAAGSEVVKAQLGDPKKNILTGKGFDEEKEKENDEKKDDSSDSDKKQSDETVTVATHPIAASMVLMATIVPDGDADSDGQDSPMGEEGEGGGGTSDSNGDDASDGTDDGSGTGEEESSEQGGEPAKYKVSFVNYDGSSLSDIATYSQGETVTNLPDFTPERAQDASHSYAFIGWVSESDDPGHDGRYYATADIPPVAADVTYRAFYYAMPAPAKETPDKEGLNEGNPNEGSFSEENSSESLINALRGLSPSAEALSELSGRDMSNLGGIDMSQYMGMDPSSYPQDLHDYYGMMGMPDASGLGMSGLDLSGMTGMGDVDLSGMSDEEIAKMLGMEPSGIAGVATGLELSDGQLQALLAGMSDTTPDTYQKVLDALGYATEDQPSSIAIYPADFSGKSAVEDFISDYNSQSLEAEQVTYTDLIGLMVQEITSIVDTISYVLIAFVAISLVVSSIMIAIITYISVLERTKEIGVLRALGASKGDVSKIFNAETLIEGLLAGLIGVGTTALLCIPISAVIEGIIDVPGIATLPSMAGGVLVGVSVLLTLVAGFVPSRVASKKDPAVSLRSE